jgi:hypothetical protein
VEYCGFVKIYNPTYALLYYCTDKINLFKILLLQNLDGILFLVTSTISVWPFSEYQIIELYKMQHFQIFFCLAKYMCVYNIICPSFSAFIIHLFLLLNIIWLDWWGIFYLSIYLLKDILVVLSFSWLWIKLL